MNYKCSFCAGMIDIYNHCDMNEVVMFMPAQIDDLFIPLVSHYNCTDVWKNIMLPYLVVSGYWVQLGTLNWNCIKYFRQKCVSYTEQHPEDKRWIDLCDIIEARYVKDVNN